MKGAVSAADLAAAVKTARSIIPAGISNLALGHIRLTSDGSMLEVEATNMDQHMMVSLPAKLSKGFALVDPARLLMALQPISGEATLSCADSFMSLSGRGARTRLALLSEDSWASISMPAAEASFEVKPESLRAAIETVLPATLKDASVYYLCGCHLKWDGPDLIAEATDKHILLTRQIVARRPDNWPRESIILPAEFMIAADKLLNAESASLSVTANRIILATPKGRLASKLIAASYPDTDKFWDKRAAPALRADRKSLLSVVKLANQFSDVNAAGERSLIVHEGEVITVGANGEKFRAAFECEYIKPIDYSYQPKILLTALEAFTSEIVELTDGGQTPHVVVIHGDGVRTCIAMQKDLPGWWRREMAAEKAAA